MNVYFAHFILTRQDNKNTIKAIKNNQQDDWQYSDRC